MLADDPRDTFLRYSLALELEKEGEHERSLSLLRELADESPPYVAAFFKAGQQLARLGRMAEAREILSAMEAAKARGEGATVYKGRLVDIASIKQAEVIVRQAEMIAAGA